ncbi:hypothetical protein HYU11_03865 [Candidatus Woesearchaeota archaeon]|nr:hypothetical protein [Candidatus Woesearchaeota archaeon]
MGLLGIKKLVEESECFISWRSGHKDPSLMLILAMFEELPATEWLVSYFDGLAVTTFSLDGEKCTIRGEESAVQEPKSITLLGVKELEEIIGPARELLKGERCAKTIAILQKLETQVWNISFMTLSYKILNVRIDSETGNILSHDFGDIFARL